MSWDTDRWRGRISMGEECFIGEGCYFSEPGRVVLKGRCRIDPGVHVTAGLVMGENSVICSGAKLTGGGVVVMGRWGFIGYNAQVHTATEKYGESLVNAWWGRTKCHRGDVGFGDYAGVASGSIVFPGVTFPEGAALGAMSLLTKESALREWWISLGIPAKPWKERERLKIMEQERSEGFLRRHS